MKFDTEPKGRLVHTLDLSPPWGHMDALGHINNTQYFAYCEQARISWLESMSEIDYLSGLSLLGPVVINAACTFHRQVVYPCHLKIDVYAENPGRSSFVTRYVIRSAESGTTHATGAAKIVWIDYKAEKSVPLPEKIRSAVSGKKEESIR